MDKVILLLKEAHVRLMKASVADIDSYMADVSRAHACVAAALDILDTEPQTSPQQVSQNTLQGEAS